MAHLATYQIPITALKNKTYQYQYTIDEDFFKHFEQGIGDKPNIGVALTLEKDERMLQLNFEMKGKVELICDRSLESFEYPIQEEARIILKFGEKTETISEELEIIHRDTTIIQVAQYIYEFLMLAIPLKKLHPKYQGTEEETQEESFLIYQAKTTEEEKKTDPRWETLKKLKKQ